MRDYGRIYPQFWIGRTGKRLRKAGMEAQIVAMYLLTNPHTNMLGLYYLPTSYIGHETGLSADQVERGMSACKEAGFCAYDDDSEMVWVVEMARFQIGETLSDNDKRCKGVQSEYDALPSNPFLGEFFRKYSKAFHMVCERYDTAQESTFEAPSKPLRSQEQEQEQEQKQEQEQRGGAYAELALCHDDAAIASASPQPQQRRGNRLPESWTLPDEWRAWAMQEQPTWSAEHAAKVAANFRDYWVAKPGKDGVKLDWLATWRQWVRREQPMRGVAQRATAPRQLPGGGIDGSSIGLGRIL